MSSVSGRGNVRGGGRQSGRGGGRQTGRAGGRGGNLTPILDEVNDETRDQERGEDIEDLTVGENSTTEAEQSTLVGGHSMQVGENSSCESNQLDPNSLWFDDNIVTQAITNAFQQYFNEPWRNWSEVNKETKDYWFDIFKRKFSWEPELDQTVRKAFNKKAGKRLKDMHNHITLRMKGEKPSWMGDDVHKRMMERREKDEDFKKRSKQAKKNKRGGSLENAIEPPHFQGSISGAEHAKRLAKQNGGVLPKAGDLYLKFHSKEKEPGKGKELIGTKPKQLMGEYEKKMAEYKDKGIDKDPNEVYYETVGGRKRGLIPGLGTAGDLLFKKPSSRSDKSSGNAPSLLSQLSTRVEQQAKELEAQRIELEKQRVAMEAQRLQCEQEKLEEARKMNEKMNEYIAEMKRTMEEYTRANCRGPFGSHHA